MSARKRLGQHFLLDPNILNRIAAAAGPLAGRPVLEIGPGPGGLSRAILQAGAASLVAVEQDARCSAALAPLASASDGKMTVICADAMDQPFPLQPNYGEKAVIIANLPYNISAPLLVRWMDYLQRIDCMVLMFQREVAERITASPKSRDYGRLSVIVQINCRIKKLFELPPGAFSPPPSVRSSVLHITPKQERPPADLQHAVETITAVAFNQRRKMLRSSLRPLGLSVTALCADAGIPETARAEDLSGGQYLRLAQSLKHRRREIV